MVWEGIRLLCGNGGERLTMANHAYITTHHRLTKDRVFQDLQEINQRRFKGLLEVKDSDWSKKGSWFICHPQTPTRGFNIWLTSQRKLEYRHGSNWVFYTEVIFSEELGAKYDGRMSDDGCPERWQPRPDKYPSYQAYLEHQYRDCPQEIRERLMPLDLSYVPQDLRDC